MSSSEESNQQDLNEQLVKYKKKLKMVMRQKENLSGTCQDQFDYIAELTQKVDALQAALNSVEEEVKSLRAQRQTNIDIQQQLEEVNNQLAQSQRRISELETAHDMQRSEEIASLESRMNQLAAEKDFLQAQVQKFEESDSRYHAAMEENRNLHEQIIALEARITTASNEFERAVQELSKNKGQQAGLAEELRIERELTAELQDEGKQVQAALARALDTLDEKKQSEKQLQAQIEELNRQKQLLEESSKSHALDLGTSKKESVSLLEELNRKQSLWQQKQNELQKEIDNLKAAAKEYASQKIEIESKLSAIKLQNANLSEQLKANVSKLAEVEKSLAGANSEIETLQNERTAQNNDLNAAQANIKSLKLEAENLNVQLHEAKTKIQGLENDKRILQESAAQTKSQLEKQITEKSEELGRLSAQIEQLTTERSGHLEKIEQLRQVESLYKELQEKHSIVESNLHSVKEDLDSTVQELALAEKMNAAKSEYQLVLEAELSQNQAQIAELHQQKADFTTQLEQTRQLLEEANRQTAGLQSELTEKDKTLQSTCLKLSDADQRIKAAEETVSSLQSTQKSLRSEVQQKESALQALNEHLAQLKQNESILEQTIDAGRAEYAAAQDELKQKHLQLEQAEKHLAETQLMLANAKDRFEALRVDRDSLKQNFTMLSDEHKNLQLERDAQVKALKDELKETSECVAEFERLIQQVDDENADLRVQVEKTAEKVVSIQAETAKQTEINEDLKRQAAEMKHSVAMASQTEEALRQSKLQLRKVEQDLSQEKDNHEATVRQLKRQEAACADLNEKIANQSREIDRLHQQMKEILDNRQLLKNDFEELGPDPLKRKVMEMAAKIESLNLQLHERTNSLKQVQKELQQAGHASPSKAAETVKQPQKESVTDVESAPLSTGAAKASESIRKLRDELAQKRNETQQSQEKLSRVTDELEVIQTVPAKETAKKGLQHKLNFFGKRS